MRKAKGMPRETSLPVFSACLLLFPVRSAHREAWGDGRRCRSSLRLQPLRRQSCFLCLFSGRQERTPSPYRCIISMITISENVPVLKGMAQPEMPLVTTKVVFPRRSVP